MKYFTILLFSLFVFSCTNTNNTEEIINVDDIPNVIEGVKEKKIESKIVNRTDDEIVKDIKAQYKIVIDSKAANRYNQDSMEYECPDYPEYGTIVYHKNDTGIWMIEHNCSQGDHGGRMDQYFLWKGELFFVYSDEGYWTFGGGMIDEDMPGTIDYITEKRYYFDKERVVKTLEKKFELKSASKNNPKSNEVSNKEIVASEEEKKELLKTFKKLVSIANETDFKGECIWE